MNERDFLNNSLIQDGVIKNLEIIGEAKKQLDPEFRLKYPNIEWKKIAGMRDKLIHDYIGVDLWAVWAVVEKVIPQFKEELTTIIRIEKNKNQ
ncbi:HepT-like ribonuclease domain-containing protein [Marivirga sp.]|uniref:HepT-like ribonuclease domain-containing protein n=1 Tax=Marivirga sp. TaxID=2018662 RepID=UPI003DA78B83